MILLDEGMRLCLVPSPWNSDKDQKKNEENPFSFTLFKSRLEEDVERATLFAQGHWCFLEAVRAVIENTTHNRNGFHSCSFIQLQHSSLQKNAKQAQISTTNRPPSPILQSFSPHSASDWRGATHFRHMFNYVTNDQWDCLKIPSWPIKFK